MKKYRQGVIYVVSGFRQNYVEEVNLSIGSLLEHNPNMLICVFVSDMSLNIDDRAQKIKIDKPELSFFDKIYAISNSPFDYSVFLDTDTYVCDDLSDVFIMLDRFDVCLAIDPSSWKGYHSPGYSKKYGIPESFPEFNTGVFAFRKSQEFSQLIELWTKFYHENSTSLDQPTFRVALYKSNVRICPLIQEYNLRVGSGPCCIQSGPKIFHARLAKKQFINLRNKMSHPLLKGIRVAWIPTIGVRLLDFYIVRQKMRKVIRKMRELVSRRH